MGDELPPFEEPPVEQEPKPWKKKRWKQEEAKAEAKPDPIEVTNEGSRDPEFLKFTKGLGGSVLIHHGNFTAILTQESFQKVMEWYKTP
jgi:hypothetical protein